MPKLGYGNVRRRWIGLHLQLSCADRQMRGRYPYEFRYGTLSRRGDDARAEAIRQTGLARDQADRGPVSIFRMPR